jgi:hypothetical protein
MSRHRWEPTLGRQDDPVATSLQYLAEHGFRRPRAISVGRVDQVDAGLECHIELMLGGGYVNYARFSLRATDAEGSGPEREAGHPQS